MVRHHGVRYEKHSKVKEPKIISIDGAFATHSEVDGKQWFAVEFTHWVKGSKRKVRRKSTRTVFAIDEMEAWKIFMEAYELKRRN